MTYLLTWSCLGTQLHYTRTIVKRCPSDQQEFQSDLDNLCECSQRNLMDVNVKKCKLLRITKKRMPFLADLKLNGCSLDEKVNT